MATTKNSTSQKDTGSKGNFANMDDKKQKEVASKGGKAHGSTSKSHK